MRRENVYNIDDVWCPGCDQRLPKRNKGCRHCGWEDTKRGRVMPVRHYLSVYGGTLSDVCDAWICRVFMMGRHPQKGDTHAR